MTQLHVHRVPDLTEGLAPGLTRGDLLTGHRVAPWRIQRNAVPDLIRDLHVNPTRDPRHV